MERLQHFMLRHPYVSLGILTLPALVIVVAVFSILINIILPAILAFWLAGWMYTAIVGRPVRRYYKEPFWYTRDTVY